MYKKFTGETTTSVKPIPMGGRKQEAGLGGSGIVLSTSPGDPVAGCHFRVILSHVKRAKFLYHQLTITGKVL